MIFELPESVSIAHLLRVIISNFRRSQSDEKKKKEKNKFQKRILTKHKSNETIATIARKNVDMHEYAILI